MSLSKTRILVSIALAFAGSSLSACGYTPLYGRSSGGAQVTAELSQIEVRPIVDRVGQMMRTELKRSLSPQGLRDAPQYRLTVTLSEGLAQLAVEESAFATRANLTLSSAYSLVRSADGLEILAGTADSVASYNILSSDFATQSAQSNARERAIVNLAQTIRQRLAVYFLSAGGQADTSVK